MFTGIVATTGSIARLDQHASHVDLVVECPALDLGGAEIGESIAVSGVCLTVTAFSDDGFTTQLSPETLACTNLQQLAAGSRVNLERALKACDRLGGHMVSGHIDGVGSAVNLRPDNDGMTLSVEVPRAISRYIARKGSICVDGVSLTVNAVENNVFTVQIIPHTLAVTTIGNYRTGTRVNIEVDIIARYLERLVARDNAPLSARIDEAMLQRCGFID